MGSGRVIVHSGFLLRWIRGWGRCSAGKSVRGGGRAPGARPFAPSGARLRVCRPQAWVGRAARCRRRMGRHASSSESTCVLHVIERSRGNLGAAYGSFLEDGARKQRKCLSKWQKSRGGPGLKTPDSPVMPQ